MSAAVGIYRQLVISGNLVYLSGHGPMQADGTFVTGRVGCNLTLQQGHDAARLTALSMLKTLETELGSLDRIRKVVRLVGVISSAPDFYGQPEVMDGCSEEFRKVFGDENGVGVRCAFGTSVLPFNIAIEVEGQFEID